LLDLLSDLEDCGEIFLRNVVWHLTDFMPQTTKFFTQKTIFFTQTIWPPLLNCFWRMRITSRTCAN
jgi:hypothetical protein